MLAKNSIVARGVAAAGVKDVRNISPSNGSGRAPDIIRAPDKHAGTISEDESALEGVEHLRAFEWDAEEVPSVQHSTTRGSRKSPSDIGTHEFAQIGVAENELLVRFPLGSCAYWLDISHSCFQSKKQIVDTCANCNPTDDLTNDLPAAPNRTTNRSSLQILRQHARWHVLGSRLLCKLAIQERHSSPVEHRRPVQQKQSLVVLCSQKLMNPHTPPRSDRTQRKNLQAELQSLGERLLARTSWLMGLGAQACGFCWLRVFSSCRQCQGVGESGTDHHPCCQPSHRELHTVCLAWQLVWTYRHLVCGCKKVQIWHDSKRMGFKKKFAQANMTRPTLPREVSDYFYSGRMLAHSGVIKESMNRSA
jgi:hypothetical protein